MFEGLRTLRRAFTEVLQGFCRSLAVQKFCVCWPGLKEQTFVILTLKLTFFAAPWLYPGICVIFEATTLIPKP